jgi:hypothetical protein
VIPYLLASTIVIRHDKPDTDYLVSRGMYPAAARVCEMAEGTLVGPRHVLTAAHVVDYMHPFRAFVELGGRRYDVTRVLYHPLAKSNNFRKRIDLALLVLKEPVKGIRPVPIYPLRDEVGKIATLFGSGTTGNGRVGESKYDRKARAAQNRVDFVTNQFLKVTFDPPGKGLPNEGVTGNGDSGGPAYLTHNGKTYLAGVTHKNEPVEGGPVAGYKSIGVYVRTSPQRTWVTDAIAGKNVIPWGWQAPTDKLKPSLEANCVRDYFSMLNKGTPETGFEQRWPRQIKPLADAAKLRARFGTLTPKRYAQCPNGRLIVAVDSAKLKRPVLCEFHFDQGKPTKLVQIRFIG